MSRVLCTHPGKAGDIFWALPAMRALAEIHGEPVDFLTSAIYKRVLGIIERQPYIRRARYHPHWNTLDTAPMTPRIPPTLLGEYPEQVCHLGYKEWPRLPLAFEAATNAELPEAVWRRPEFLKPWITLPDTLWPERSTVFFDVAVGFTHEWIELKAGILLGIADKLRGTGRSYDDYSFTLLYPPGSRWASEFAAPLCRLDAFDSLCGDLLEVAWVIQRSILFLGCLSAPAVLAMALGKPRVLVEPNNGRWHEIFQHPDTPLVLGNDGRPTFDARHVADALLAKLAELRRTRLGR